MKVWGTRFNKIFIGLIPSIGTMSEGTDSAPKMPKSKIERDPCKDSA